MTKNLIILLLALAVAYLIMGDRKERRFVPNESVALVRDAAGTVSDETLSPGPVWLNPGEALAVYRTRQIDVTLPAPKLRWMLPGAAVPAMGITYDVDERDLKRLRGALQRKHRWIRRDHDNRILVGFQAVVLATDAALKREALGRSQAGGVCSHDGVPRACLSAIGEVAQGHLDAWYDSMIQVRSVWVSAPGFDRIEVSIGG